MRVPDNNWFHPGPARMSDSTVASLRLPRGATLHDLSFRGTDSAQLYALVVRTPGARSTIVYFGGDNFRVATGGAGLARAAGLLGVNAVLVDYRGYGRSEGTPTLSALQSDALALVDRVKSLDGIRETAIVVHGFSMGSFIAGHISEHRPIDGLVLEGSATSVNDWARNIVPWYARPFVRVRLSPALGAESNAERVERYRGPLLVVVGAKDRVTRPSMSHELYRRAGTPSPEKRLLVVPGAGHGDALQNEAAAREYAAFLNQVAMRRP
jgi:uncharacterized protein